MTPGMRRYKALGLSLASSKGLHWDMKVDSSGNASAPWSLRDLVGASIGPDFSLHNFASDEKALAEINRVRQQHSVSQISEFVLSEEWRDLIKCVCLDSLLVRGRTHQYVYGNILRGLRVIATCCHGKSPAEITVDDIRLAIQISENVQKSGVLRESVISIVKNFFDTHGIQETCPLFPLLGVERRPPGRLNNKVNGRRSEPRGSLKERKNAERLPEKKAFWELVRIVFTEQPKSFTDAIRFCMIRLSVMTGLRIGEIATIPLNWRDERHYFDGVTGRPAGEIGGVSSAIFLRHFAEKQQNSKTNSIELYPATQAVPRIFESAITSTLNEAERLTKPLRDTLRMQVESGRILPWYRPDQLVSIVEVYARVSGDPFFFLSDRYGSEKVNQIKDSYAKSLDVSILDDYWEESIRNFSNLDGVGPFAMRFYMYIRRARRELGSNKRCLVVRDFRGKVCSDHSAPLSNLYVLISEFEEFLSYSAKTKLSDLAPHRVSGGPDIEAWQFMFLTPKRDLGVRDGSVCDPGRYCFINVPEPYLVMSVLGESKGQESLFERYCSDPEDQRLFITSHQIRHLQNNVLFMNGVADTIITKRFNRRSVSESHEYDHRTLAEHLEEIDIPQEVEFELGHRASTVYKMIKGGKASGKIVDTFKEVQKIRGDGEAFEYLRLEADGLHATPYGYCLNSFQVDPCPKHLECFAGCRHLSVTDLDEHHNNLQVLRDKYESIVKLLESGAKPSVGYENQLRHARERLAGLEAALTTKPGERVFPDGTDLSEIRDSRSVLDD